MVFATAKGNVRRNALSDFANVRANGKIAMKLEGEDADDRLIAVAICTDDDDILLATRNGKCIRFPVDATCASSPAAPRSACAASGSRPGDAVMSMSILRHEDVPTAQRYAYLRLSSRAPARRGRRGGRGRGDRGRERRDGENGNGSEADGGRSPSTRSNIADLAAREEFVLTVTEKGFGKRTSAYDYPITGRGGQGLENIELDARQGATVAVFPVAESDQIMLVTDGGR